MTNDEVLAADLPVVAHPRTRLAAVRLAAGWMAASRLASFIAQAVAVPIVLSAIGRPAFGAYSTIAAALIWVSTCSLGVAPALLLHLRRTSDPALQRDQVRTAWIVNAFTLLTGAFAVTVLLLLGPMSAVLGSSFASYDNDLRFAALAIVWLTVGQLLLSPAESVQAVQMRQHVTFIWQTVGNFGVLVLLLGVAWAAPSIVAMAIAFQVPLLLAKIGNTLQVLRGGAYTFRGGQLRLGVGISLLRTGAAFALVQVASFVALQAGLVWTARELGPDQAAVASIAVRFMLLAGSGMAVVTQAFWPAVADAVSAGDSSWVRHALRRVIALCMAVAIGIVFLMVLTGGPLLTAWSAGAMVIDASFAAAIGIAFAIDTWVLVFHHTLVGLQRPWLATGVYILSGIIQFVTVVILVAHLGVLALPLAVIVADLSLAAWFLPRKVALAIRSLSDRKVALLNPIVPENPTTPGRSTWGMS